MRKGQRTRPLLTGTRRRGVDETVKMPHPDSCIFCRLPDKEIIKINGSRTVTVNGRPYELAININPYFDGHVSLLAGSPEPQYLSREKIADSLTFQKGLGSGFSGFYVSPKGGATVPHFHAKYKRTPETPVWRNLKEGRIVVA
ncbi:MAG: hypothetical protein ABIH74_05670, partial [Candidatus Omnitrophota bacterium]